MVKKKPHTPPCVEGKGSGVSALRTSDRGHGLGSECITQTVTQRVTLEALLTHTKGWSDIRWQGRTHTSHRQLDPDTGKPVPSLIRSVSPFTQEKHTLERKITVVERRSRGRSQTGGLGGFSHISDVCCGRVVVNEKSPRDLNLQLGH